MDRGGPSCCATRMHISTKIFGPLVKTEADYDKRLKESQA